MGWKSFMVFPLKFAGAGFVENRAVELLFGQKKPHLVQRKKGRGGVSGFWG
jgi:hypothetical protein